MKKREPQPFAKPIKQQWLRKHLKKRECCCYFPEGHDRHRLCACGRKKNAHTAGYSVAGLDVMKWTPAKHTKELPTDAAGLVVFPGASNVGSACASHYARVSATTDEGLILELLLHQWKLPRPAIVISVTGGAQNIDLPPAMRERFKKGLLEVGSSSNAWLVSGGTHTGVMKLVGEVLAEQTRRNAKPGNVSTAAQRGLCAIGMVAWGAIEERSSLVQGSYSPLPVKYTARSYCALDQNHSHFILVDDGTVGRFGVEIKFRARMERAISKCHVVRDDGSLGRVSVVMLAVEGGPNTLKNVRQSLSRGTPAVLLLGSGRAVDVLTYAYQNATISAGSDGDHWQVPDSALPDLRRRLREKFSLSQYSSLADQRLLAQCEEDVQCCVKYRDLIHIVDIMDGGDTDQLDYAILKALSQANAGSTFEQLDLALTWNRADFAEKEVFSQTPTWKEGALDSVLMRALVEEKVAFVKLLLSNKVVSIERFASRKHIVSLYNAFSSVACLRTAFLKLGILETGNLTLADLESLIGWLVGEANSQWYRFTSPETRSSTPVGGAHNECFSSDADGSGVDGALSSQSQIGSATPRPTVSLRTRPGSARPASAINLATGVTLGSPLTTGILPVSMNAGSNLGESSDGKHESLDDEDAASSCPLEDDWEMAANHLFLWSVLSARMTISKVLWQFTTEPIAAALLACKLLRTLAGMLANDQTYHTEREELFTLATSFENLAIGVLSQCHKIDDFTAHRVLRRTMPSWGLTTCLALAEGGDSRQFMAHLSCQALISTAWMGRLQPQNTSFMICLGIIAPPLLPWAVTFLQYSADETEKVVEKYNDQDTLSLAPTLHELAFARPLSPIQQEYLNRVEYEQATTDRPKRHGKIVLPEYSKPALVKSNSLCKMQVNPLIAWSKDSPQHAPSGKDLLRQISDQPPCHQDQMQGIVVPERVFGHFAQDDLELEDLGNTCTADDDDLVYIIGGGKEDKSGKTYYELTFVQRYVAFYAAPVVKFWMSLLTYIVFLGMFSYMLLTQWKSCWPTIIEYLIMFYVANLISIEMRQLSHDPANLWKDKIKAYFGSLWNWLDIGSMVLYLAHLPLRYSCPSVLQCITNNTAAMCNATGVLLTPSHVYPAEIRWARILCTTSCLFLFLRLLQIFTINSELGPKIHMILKMILDVLEFGLIFVVFVVSFGVTSQALLYPTEAISWTSAKEIFYRPYWQIYGEFFLETVAEGGAACGGAGQRACPKREFLPIILLAVYALLSNVLLIDLLSAVFNNTYEEVQSQALAIWKFNRYSLVLEYLSRSRWPPPLSVISYTLHFLAGLCGKSSELSSVSELAEAIEDDGEIQQLQDFERFALQRFVEAEAEENSGASSEDTSLAERLHELEVTVQRLHHTLQVQAGTHQRG